MTDTITKDCSRHGNWEHVLENPNSKWKRYRCKKCRSEAVSKRRRAVKSILVMERGGACTRCGYDKYVGALDFHHRDPTTKEFNISRKGLTLSLARMRIEADKCDLLCANCHREVENGFDPV